jgi:signal transduction histidine kinase
VASHWRIRHKLMLGLGLVVAIMALLLGGTLRGLWSNYVTMNSIRYKLAELVAAEELKAVLADMTSPGQIRVYRDKPGTLEEALGRSRGAITAYENQLQETLIHCYDPGDGLLESTHAQELHENIDEYEKAVRPLITPSAVAVGEAQQREDDENKVKPQVEKLQLNGRTLRDHIKDSLDNRINESRRHYQVSLWIIVPASVLGLLCVAGLMRSFYAWVFNPIRDLQAGVNRVAQGDFDHRIELNSGDEMEDFSKAFNDMTQRLQELYTDLARQVNERSRQLVRSERLASVGFLAAGVAHEINNPLASIAFCSEALEARIGEVLRQLRLAGRGGDDPAVFAKYLKMIQDEAFRCKSITERLLAFSRTGERRREPTDLGQLIQSVLDITQHLQNSRGKQIAFEVNADRVPGGRVVAWVHGEEVKSVVLNLVVNALDSMDEGGKLTIRLSQRDGMAEMQFIDTGCGMTREILENIFEPFFTRSRTGKGTGLGLTISYQIVCQHGGELDAFSAGPNQGSTFTVRLPLQAVETSTADETRNTTRSRAA